MHILQLQMHDLKMLRVLAWLTLTDCCVGFEIDHPLGLIWCLHWSACKQHGCILLRVNWDSAVQRKRCSLERPWLKHKKCRGPFTWPAWNGSTAYDRLFFQNPNSKAYCVLRTCMLHRVGVFGASFTFIKREEQKTEYSSMCGEKGWSPSMCRENGMKHLSWTLARESLRTCTSGSLATFSENLLVKKSTSSEFRKKIKGVISNAIDWGVFTTSRTNFLNLQMQPFRDHLI